MGDKDDAMFARWDGLLRKLSDVPDDEGGDWESLNGSISGSEAEQWLRELDESCGPRAVSNVGETGE